MERLILFMNLIKLFCLLIFTFNSLNAVARERKIFRIFQTGTVYYILESREKENEISTRTTDHLRWFKLTDGKPKLLSIRATLVFDAEVEFTFEDYSKILLPFQLSKLDPAELSLPGEAWSTKLKSIEHPMEFFTQQGIIYDFRKIWAANDPFLKLNPIKTCNKKLQKIEATPTSKITAQATHPVTLHIGVATSSAVKLAAVKNAFQEMFPNTPIELHPYKVDSQVASQPVGETWGVQGAKNRLANAIAKMNTDETAHPKFDYWVSMENYIEPSLSKPGFWIDRAAVVIQSVETSLPTLQLSKVVYLPETFASAAKNKSNGQVSESGYEVTSGEVIREAYLKRGIELPADDWHQHADFGGVPRSQILQETIQNAVIQAAVKKHIP